MTCAWLPVVGYEGRYEVSDTGRVRSTDYVGNFTRGGQTFPISYKGQERKLTRNSDGYFKVNLSFLYGGKPAKRCSVSRLVAEAFLGPCPEGHQVCHNDGDNSNNNLSNLRWGTVLENHADKKRHGTNFPKEHFGEAHKNSKLTVEKVKELRERVSNGESTRSVALEFGIGESTARQAVNRVTWRSVS